MAKYTRKTLNREDAKAILGEAWEFAISDGRDGASFFSYTDDPDIYPGLYHFDENEATLICEEGEIEVKNQPLWPHWDCRIDLTNFYTDGNNIPHPLAGFYIPELIEATNYPFHNKERVRAILARNEYNSLLIINHRVPNVVIFVETWSHYDELAQSSQCSPETEFRLYDGSGLSTTQLSSAENHIGKNFIIMPLGYNHGKPTTVGDVERWKGIIQRFLNGETAPEEATNDANSPENALSVTDNAATVAAKADYFAEFQRNLAEKYRDEFLSTANVSKAAEHEAYLGEAEDKNGALLYTVATEFESVDALQHYETINGVSYLVRRYNYCQAHLEKLESDLVDLMAHEK